MTTNPVDKQCGTGTGLGVIGKGSLKLEPLV
jgi:hypothetical protein